MPLSMLLTRRPLVGFAGLFLLLGFVGGAVLVPKGCSGVSEAAGERGAKQEETDATGNENGDETEAQEPLGLFLTWRRDPTTTMSVDWHAPDATSRTLHYKPVGAEEWRTQEATPHNFPYSARVIYRTTLTGLEPGGSYRFRVGDFERRYKFRTLPAENHTEPLVFAAGGDTRHRQSLMERTNRVAMQYEPDFIVWGGDLAYADGRPDRVGRWYEFFDAIMNTLIDDDGRVVPIVVCIGNHEVRRGYLHRHDDYVQTDEFRERIAPYFYALFDFPGQPGYGVLDVADYLSLVILDSDHSNPVDGAQTEWLAEVLAEREDVPHVLPVYHVAAYPSHRSYGGRVQRRIREHWVPLLERHGIRVAFENHDHTYKRTHPIRDGEISGDGIIYLGDGAWGVGTREGNSSDEWYINRFASKRHAIIVTLHGSHQHFLMVSEHGDVIDEYPQTPHGLGRGE